MNKKFKIIVVFAMILGILSAWFIFGKTISNKGNVYLYIPANSKIDGVKDSLKQKEILHNFLVFDVLSNLMDYPNNIKPGKYTIPNKTSIFNLVRMLRKGRQAEVRFTITKLRTREDLAQKMSEKFDITTTEALQFLNKNDSLKRFDVDTHTVMTLIIPNTYLFWWNSSVSGILERLKKQHDYFWEGKRKLQADQLKLTEEQVYTIASIVEEETNMKSDKGKIARVYINRIDKGMKLEADPTVKFAMRNFELTRIMHKHLSHPSAYNTYYQKGLPPGPICTPSIETIDEVLNAPPSDHIFFVAKPTFDGYSNFSSTYAEHQKFAKEYQKALDNLMKK